MFEAIFNRHNVPTADREALSRYFAKPDGIPRSLRDYIFSRQHRQLLNSCLKTLTRNFVETLR